jgi:hypothetical protein
MFVTFLSDFGLRDDFVGTCHGVIKRIAPDVQIVDITHGIPARAIVQGALVLANTVPYMPSGVHLAVVDPGVGGPRRALALRDGDGRLYVGPDNGLLLPAAERAGVSVAHEIVNPEYALSPVSRTFHGRDIFAPAAAHLAAGMPPGDLGPVVDPASLERLDVPGPMVAPGAVGARVTATDGFGNVQLNATEVDLDAAGVAGGRVLVVNGRRLPRAGTFAELPEREPGLIIDSDGHLAIVVNRGNAAVMLGLAAGDAVVVEGS